MKEWKTYKLGELAEITSSKRIFLSDYVAEGVPFYRSKEIIQQFHKEDISIELFISREKFDEIKNKFGSPQKDDILLTSVGTIGIPYLIKSTDEFYFKDGNLTWFRNFSDVIYPQYLFYWLQSVEGKKSIEQSKIGSTQQAITIMALKHIEINMPSMQTQRQITQILTSLDEKIELNLQMNQTLEALSQAIFKEWFVDFHFPGFDGVLVEGLPKGWRMGNVLEIALLLSGGTPKTDVSEFWNGDINWISAKDITNSNGRFLVETEKTITELGIDKSAAKLLPQNTTIVSARGTVGNYCILSKEMAISQSNYGLKSIHNTDFFLFLLVGNMTEMMKAYSYGTVFDTITTKTFQEMEIIIPSNEAMANFEEYVTPFYVKMLENQQQNQTLTQLRDGLLPRLMGGKIKIMDVSN
jgi:type I restriction enzyme S subunit